METTMDTTYETNTYTSPARATVLGLRLSALVEILLALGIMLFIDIAAFDRTRFWGVNPHPFWLIVLFIACKYGTKEAIISALVCTLALLIGNMPEHTMGQDSYSYLFYVLKLPL